MQTFLPYSDFRQCAKVLDYKRLGKQRVEAFQIMNCLTLLRQGGKNGWSQHNAVKMWVGYDSALGLYMNIMIDEWIERGYKNTMQKSPLPSLFPPQMPEWMGDERLHASHRANLIRKLPDHYLQFGWTEDPETGYWWPYRKKNGNWECYIY